MLTIILSNYQYCPVPLKGFTCFCKKINMLINFKNVFGLLAADHWGSSGLSHDNLFSPKLHACIPNGVYFYFEKLLGLYSLIEDTHKYQQSQILTTSGVTHYTMLWLTICCHLNLSPLSPVVTFVFSQ